ncbi:hypothetical protein ASE69_20885 [Sphingomonas sp. Leaf208]|uniref:hypothetical protein n=1 Tax=Sphingomonas sp. Leaf208 TaxID=1735679 RepID=UPI0006F8991E|nr:hypothetical protein [Sphingomonas sp. Leaf208]KQM50070.1 hypothetical protein ASE69_20885 [Sphingomonas sp. Leaf208]
MISDRDAWMKAGVIVAEYGTLTTDYIISQLGDVIDGNVAVEDWRRVATAVDAITNALRQ